MKQKIIKQINYWLGVIAIGLILGVSLQFVRAWTEPAEAPPGGNLEAPINVSNSFQFKKAGLMLNTSGISENGLLVSNGNVGIGTTTPGAKLEVNGAVKLGSQDICDSNAEGAIRYNSGSKTTEVCDGSGWREMGK